MRAYVDGAAADGLTRRAGRAAFDALALQPRVLAPLAGLHTGRTLCGAALPWPVLVAPTAHHGLLHAEAECATARGAGAAESLMVVSAQANRTLEDIAAAAAGPLWFQLYWQASREANLALMRRAEAAGYGAIVLTVDAPVNGIRNEEHRAGFRLPPGLAAVNLAPPPPPPIGASRTELLRHLLAAAPGWADVAWLRQATRLPLLLKGVLAPEDAIRAVEAGADGVIVSNHGGRTLDTLPATLHALPAVAAAVAGRAAVLLDGEIRRGTDVLKALALGADAVLVGRPVLHALAVAGPLGVAHMLGLLRTEIEVAMALTGRATLAEIGPDLVSTFAESQHPAAL